MSRGRIIIALAVVVVAVNAVVFPTVSRRMNAYAGAPVRPLDLRAGGYAPADAYATLAALGVAGRRFYVGVEMTVDIAYPVVYAMLFVLLIEWLGARGPVPVPWSRRAALFPLASAILDVAENVAILRMAQRFPARADGAARVASVLTMLKWPCFAITLVIVAWLGMRALTRRARVAA